VARTRVATAALTVILLAAATAAPGCGLTDRLRAAATSTAVPLDRAPQIPVGAPDAHLADNPVVTAARSSVVKVRGVSHSCQKILEGSGFVVAPNRVMATAHEVAGTDSASVEVDGTQYDAQVVSYDPNRDIAILDVPELQAAPLPFAEDVAESGADALLLGYPGGAEFMATPVRIREYIELDGPDIYRTTTATREVYTIRGAVRQGSSGGPLIDLDGHALGLRSGLRRTIPISASY
jgi:S1-C subfamily serine protease